MMTKHSEFLISIIITTKNEEKNIVNCLRSINNQTYKNIEIIIVDNASNDRTQEISHQYTELVFSKGPERSAQRNFGVRMARGEFILYLDADMILSEKVIEHCVDKVNNDPNVIALYISEIVLGNSYFSRVRRFERSFYDGTVVDCARFIDRKVFLEIGGFDETMSGPEDWDLDKRLRNVGAIKLITTPILHNEVEFNLRKYLSKKGYYVQSFGKYINKWGKKDPDIKKQFGLYYRYAGVFIENGKWKKLFRYPSLLAGMYFLRVCIGLKLITASNRMKTKFNFDKKS